MYDYQELDQCNAILAELSEEVKRISEKTTTVYRQGLERPTIFALYCLFEKTKQVRRG